MKSLRVLPLLLLLVASAGPIPVRAQPAGNYIQHFDTLYNNLTVEKRGSVVELRARSRRGDFVESAVDLDDPLRLVVPYTRTLFAGLFFQPQPERVLMIGLGGAGFHRLFTASFPEALLQSVELDPKVYELCQTHLGFHPTDRTPVEIMDGRQYIKRHREKWDWIILDAFRGGYVPPHLKTEEFYRECAERLSERGVFITNLHATTQLYFADLKTLQKVFPQVVIFHTEGRGNVIACAVNYRSPDVTRPEAWPSPEKINPRFDGRLDLAKIRGEHEPIPAAEVARAKVMTDDFAPVEFLNVIENNNTGRER